jgi:hypothetical protein
MHNENATNPPCHFGKCLGTSLSPNCPCDYREVELDTAATLQREGRSTSSAGKSEGTEGEIPTAGVAPNGTESRTGVKTEDDDFFRHLMESNEPVVGISATNRDWRPLPQPHE